MTPTADATIGVRPQLSSQALLYHDRRDTPQRVDLDGAPRGKIIRPIEARDLRDRRGGAGALVVDTRDVAVKNSNGLWLGSRQRSLQPLDEPAHFGRIRQPVACTRLPDGSPDFHGDAPIEQS